MVFCYGSCSKLIHQSSVAKIEVTHNIGLRTRVFLREECISPPIFASGYIIDSSSSGYVSKSFWFITRSSC